MWTGRRLPYTFHPPTQLGAVSVPAIRYVCLTIADRCYYMQRSMGESGQASWRRRVCGGGSARQTGVILMRSPANASRISEAERHSIVVWFRWKEAEIDDIYIVFSAPGDAACVQPDDRTGIRAYASLQGT